MQARSSGLSCERNSSRLLRIQVARYERGSWLLHRSQNLSHIGESSREKRSRNSTYSSPVLAASRHDRPHVSGSHSGRHDPGLTFWVYEYHRAVGLSDYFCPVRHSLDFGNTTRRMSGSLARRWSVWIEWWRLAIWRPSAIAVLIAVLISVLIAVCIVTGVTGSRRLRRYRLRFLLNL